MKMLVSIFEPRPQCARTRATIESLISGRRQVGAAGARAVQHQVVDAVRAGGRDRRGKLAALRRAEQAETGGAGRVGDREGRRHLLVEGQVGAVPVGQAAPGLVVPDHGVPRGQALDEAAETEQLELRGQVGNPARVAQQRRAGAYRGVGDSARWRAAVPDRRRHPSRLAARGGAVKPGSMSSGPGTGH
jgi:hypothetical protein